MPNTVDGRSRPPGTWSGNGLGQHRDVQPILSLKRASRRWKRQPPDTPIPLVRLDGVSPHVPSAQGSLQTMNRLRFTIDSHLLQELGERLVGRPYIALAELVKNAYDADANHCEIVFSEDEIEVWDDGHGMTFDEFRDFWMRIGTTNKLDQRLSRNYGRPLTGSKGIGRLAVQFLARKVKLVTTSAMNGSQRVYAEVDWDKAIAAGELTNAEALYDTSKNPEVYSSGSPTGTKIILHRLNHTWMDEAEKDPSSVRNLASELWMLQPPFVDALNTATDRSDMFRIDMVSIDEEMEKVFRSQLTAVLELWDAKIQGHIRDGRKVKGCNITVIFRDGDTYEVFIPLVDNLIDSCDFEIRIFKLQGRQPDRIGVGEARLYFSEFGGVHVYDSGFRLPYYGIKQDWLDIQLDHSHRLSVSNLLPKELNVPLAMHDLPTAKRIFGIVHINTTQELRRTNRTALNQGKFLKINVGRDRLVDNAAYRELKRVVRWSIHYYATRYQLRQEREISKLRPKEPPKTKLERLRKTIEDVGSEVQPALHSKLVNEVDDYYKSIQSENKYVERQTSMLAPLAAAGLASLAFEHENNRQLRRLDRLVQQLSQLTTCTEEADDSLSAIVEGFRRWIKHHREIRSLFSTLTTEEDRQNVRRFRAKPTVQIVLANTRPLLRKLKTETVDIPEDLLLPLGTMAEWQALLQNLFVNASNAMLDSTAKLIRVSGGTLGRRTSYLQVSDTGAGVDTNISESLFEPFVRGLQISDEHRSMGLAGMGLGLTIVRMICETRNCKYEFVEAESGFSSTFLMTWAS